MSQPTRLLAASLAIAVTLALPLLAQEKPRTAGPVEGGYLLPNGWTITPAGEQVVLPDLPLNILPLADGKHALVTSNGYNDHDLSLVDLAKKEVLARQNVRQSWFGLAHDPATDRLWWAGGGNAMLHTYTLKGRELERTGDAEPDTSAMTKQQRSEAAKRKSFQGGVTFDPATKVLRIVRSR